jgi:hypothetical protein
VAGGMGMRAGGGIAVDARFRPLVAKVGSFRARILQSVAWQWFARFRNPLPIRNPLSGLGLRKISLAEWRGLG